MNKNIFFTTIGFLIISTLSSFAQCNVQSSKLNSDISKYSMSEVLFKELNEPYLHTIAFHINAYYDKSNSNSPLMFEFVVSNITDWQVLPTINHIEFKLPSGENIILRAEKKSYNTLNETNKIPNGLSSVEGIFYPTANNIISLREASTVKNIYVADYKSKWGFSIPLNFKGVFSEMIYCVAKDLKLAMSTTSASQNNKTGNQGYKYKTTFNDPPFKLSLYSKPDISSEVRYECPKDAEVKVIDNSGKIFCKVIVDGYSGYVSKKWLKRQF